MSIEIHAHYETKGVDGQVLVHVYTEGTAEELYMNEALLEAVRKRLGRDDVDYTEEGMQQDGIASLEYWE